MRSSCGAGSIRCEALPPRRTGGSFYHQFKDKGDLLVAVLADHSEALRRRFSELHRPDSSRSPDVIARDSYALVFEMVDQNEDIFRILLRDNADTDPRVVLFNKHDNVRWHDSRKVDYERIAEAYGFDIDVDFAAELVGMLTDGAIRYYLALPKSKRKAVRERPIAGLVTLTLTGVPGLDASRQRKAH
jgi:AcrR family transcriptional regulator